MDSIFAILCAVCVCRAVCACFTAGAVIKPVVLKKGLLAYIGLIDCNPAGVSICGATVAGAIGATGGTVGAGAIGAAAGGVVGATTGGAVGADATGSFTSPDRS